MGPPHAALLLTSNTHDQSSNTHGNNADTWLGNTLGDVLREGVVSARLERLRAEALSSSPGRRTSTSTRLAQRSSHDESISNRNPRSMVSWRSLLDQEVERRSSQPPQTTSSRDSRNSTLGDIYANRGARISNGSLLTPTLDGHQPLQDFGEGSETLLGRTVAARQRMANNSDPLGETGPYRSQTASTSARVLVREHSSNPSTWIVPPRRVIRPEPRALGQTFAPLPVRDAGRVLPQPPLARLSDEQNEHVAVGSRRARDNASDRLYVVRRRLNASNVEEVTNISLDRIDLDSPFASSQPQMSLSSQDSLGLTPRPRVTIPRRQTTISVIEDPALPELTNTLQPMQNNELGQEIGGDATQASQTSQEMEETSTFSPLPQPLPRSHQHPIVLEATQAPLGRQPWT
jgi:hypothetical protein